MLMPASARRRPKVSWTACDQGVAAGPPERSPASLRRMILLVRALGHRSRRWGLPPLPVQDQCRSARRHDQQQRRWEEDSTNFWKTAATLGSVGPLRTQRVEPVASATHSATTLSADSAEVVWRNVCPIEPQWLGCRMSMVALAMLACSGASLTQG